LVEQAAGAEDCLFVGMAVMYGKRHALILNENSGTSVQVRGDFAPGILDNLHDVLRYKAA
jgi:hypothetical protein